MTRNLSLSLSFSFFYFGNKKLWFFFSASTRPIFVGLGHQIRQTPGGSIAIQLASSPPHVFLSTVRHSSRGSNTTFLFQTSGLETSYSSLPNLPLFFPLPLAWSSLSHILLILSSSFVSGPPCPLLPTGLLFFSLIRSASRPVFSCLCKRR